MLKLEGGVSISRVHPGDGPDRIEIRIEDKSTGIRFVEATMTLEAFAEVVTGLSGRPATVELRGLENLGKTREHKEIWVSMDQDALYGGVGRQEAFKAALAPFEVDGWSEIGGRMGNSHYAKYFEAEGIKKISYRVPFVRFV